MSDSAEYPAGTYVKGDNVQVANNAASAVALVFEGYALAKADTKVEADSVAAPVTEDVNLDGPDYKELQELAKSAGIPANQSKADLEAALDAHTSTEQN